VTSLAFLPLFAERSVTRGYIGLAVAFTVGLALFAWLQERRSGSGSERLRM
jgi:hypothetical protein